MIRKGNHPLDEFHRKVTSGQAYTVWFYNHLILNGVIERTLGAPSFKEKKETIVSVLNNVRLRPDSAVPAVVQLCQDADKFIDQWSLKDSEIAWIDRLDSNELFAIWFYIRHAHCYTPFNAQPDSKSSVLALPDSLKSRVLESEDGSNGVYSNLGLLSHPGTNDEMKSCITDFVMSWDWDLTNRRNVVRQLHGLRDSVKTLTKFDFLKKHTDEEIDLVWRYLRDKKEMVGQSCDAMDSFGVARIVGVFTGWQISQTVKENALKAVKAYIKDKRSKAQSRVVKMNLTLSESSRDRLIELAGGKRKVSAYVEELIKNL